MKKSIILGGSVLSILVFIFGVYFFVRGSKPDDLNTKRNKLQADLTVAEDKLGQEKQKLDNMLKALKQSFSLAIVVQDQMRQATAIVNKTNYMFKDPTGANPTLIVKNPLTKINIDGQRQDVNTLLNFWQNNLLSISSLKLIDITESQQIEKNTETIQTYLDSLTKVVDSLTTKNSGLTQYQIDTYKAMLPPPDEIQQVIDSIKQAIQDAQNNNNSQDAGGNTTPPVNPPVTPDQVVDQQSNVDTTQKKVDNIQQQIDQIDQQINQPPVDNSNNNPNPPADTTPTPPVSTPVPPGNNTINYGVLRIIDKNQGIIVQPGPPQLIPGTDPY